VCFDPFSQAAGDTCELDELQCEVGLTCEEGVCEEVPEYGVFHCESSDQCEEGVECACSPFSGEQFCAVDAPIIPNSCESRVRKFGDCLTAHRCTLNSYELVKPSALSLTPSSCAYRECNGQYLDALSCMCGSRCRLVCVCMYVCVCVCVL
jgi:hypothetical protein